MPQRFDQRDGLLRAPLPVGPEFDELAGLVVGISSRLTGSVEVPVQQPAQRRMDLLPRVVLRSPQQCAAEGSGGPHILYVPAYGRHRRREGWIGVRMMLQVRSREQTIRREQPERLLEHAERPLRLVGWRRWHAFAIFG